MPMMTANATEVPKETPSARGWQEGHFHQNHSFPHHGPAPESGTNSDRNFHHHFDF